MSRRLTPSEIQLIRELPFFEGMALDQVEILLSTATHTEEPKGSFLFAQGDPADRFYILLEGRVKLFTANEDGEESVVEIIDSVSTFAEAALFATKRFPVNGETVLASSLVRVGGMEVMESLRTHPEIAQSLLKNMAGRYRRLTKEVIQLKTQPPAARLGAFFLMLADGREGEEVALPYGKSLIAARIGMKPESLSRALMRLRDVGVTCEKKHFVVSDIEKLRQFSSGQ